MKSKWLAAVSICAASVLAASNASAQKITDQHIQDLIKEAALRSGVTQTAPGTPPAGQPAAAQDNRPTVSLSLDEAIRLALDRNLDISVQRLNPQTFDFSLANLRAVYKPTLTSTVNQQSQTTPNTQTTSGGVVGAGTVADTTTFNAGLGQSLSWGGGTLTANINGNRGTTTSTTALFNPNYNNNWSAVYQPLPGTSDRQQPRQRRHR